ncbi:PhzF family phenazine biosynthesis protein [Actinosynnema pretiosum]|uniref:Phenazine biosynthesis protein PhzF n=1 Tax=Actinosynnema pretiosum TaxID=42197 RepID=A0A290Z028_9PSEU|nr:PhzF family phenazine biosynthesis isomerase [Actinosynnema pretiosum]ATE52355.1 phenazine biosynthesis protein PhzF [Actinosynnema pretiosum]
MSNVLRYAAFTTTPTGGNPAGVVLDARELTPERMLATAAEVGYSETAFLLPGPDPRRFAVRYFSPEAEVPFCGHATVAAAVALGLPGTITLDTAAGEVLVDVDGGTATLTSVPTRTRPAPDADVDAALAALRWSRADLDPELPVRWAFGGGWHLVVAVRDRAVLAALDYDFPALRALLAGADALTAQLVHRRAPDVFDARDPFPVGGVVEDPATGAAAAAFGGYLRELGQLPDGGRFVLHQGVDMGRPSELVVVAEAGAPGVRVTGAAVPIDERG